MILHICYSYINVLLLRMKSFRTLRKHFTITLVVISTSLSIFAQAPVANFSADKIEGCSPLTVRFTDQSTNTPTSWVWDFGNGQLSSQQNPTVNFSQPGSYTITLIVKNSFGVDEE